MVRKHTWNPLILAEFTPEREREQKPRVYLVFLGGADIYLSFLSCKNNINLATGIAAGHIISYDEDLKTVQIWRNSPICIHGNKRK